jgi:hypothetical protein
MENLTFTQKIERIEQLKEQGKHKEAQEFIDLYLNKADKLLLSSINNAEMVF